MVVNRILPEKLENKGVVHAYDVIIIARGPCRNIIRDLIVSALKIIMFLVKEQIWFHLQQIWFYLRGSIRDRPFGYLGLTE